MKKILISILLLLVSLSPVLAQSPEIKKYKGKIEQVNKIECEEELDENYICYTYDAYIKEIDKTVETMSSMLEQSQESFKVGDSVYLSTMENLDGESTWSITGYARAGSIIILSLIFVLLILFIGGLKSIGSILSLILSFLTIYLFIIPKIIDSGKVIAIGYIGVFIILVLGMYLAHGFKKTTTIALLSTIIGVAIVSLLSWILLDIFNINGFGDESAFLLSSQTEGNINIKLLFFISIILGAVGVLDDVAIGQVSSMNEIYSANSRVGTTELYRSTMNVGKEHVASMINTLFIVYAGSSLPLVLLMYLSNRDISTLLSIDMISEEIVRTLAISISLLLVVPISTYLSSIVLTHKVNSSR